MVRKLVPLTAALFAFLALAGVAQAKSSILYSVTASNVQVAKLQTGGYTVRLPSKAKVAWFTDRPARRAGNATASDLVAGWHANGFDTTPPNAAFVMTRDGATEQIIVVLKKAELQGTNVVFKAMQLRNGKMLGMQTTGTLKPGRYPRAELFVDDGAVPPCGSQMTSSSAVDCTLRAGDGYVTFHNDAPATNIKLTVANDTADAAPTSVAYDHRWRYVDTNCIPFCVSQASFPESMMTPFTQTFGAVRGTITGDDVKVFAPTDPTVVLHVQITPQSALRGRP